MVISNKLIFIMLKLSLTCNCCVKHRNNPSRNSSHAAFSFPSQPPKFEFLNGTWLGSGKEFQIDTNLGYSHKWPTYNDRLKMANSE